MACLSSSPSQDTLNASRSLTWSTNTPVPTCWFPAVFKGHILYQFSVFSFLDSRGVTSHDLLSTKNVDIQKTTYLARCSKPMTETLRFSLASKTDAWQLGSNGTFLKGRMNTWLGVGGLGEVSGSHPL